MNRRTFLGTSGAAALAPNWEWDRSVRDFQSLKQSVQRLAERSAKAKSTSSMSGALTLLGDVERVRQQASLEFLEEQAPSGWLRNIDALVLRGEGFRPFQEILIRHRERMGQCVVLKQRPKYRFRFLDPLMTSPNAMKLWLETQDWVNPWAVGNVDMDTAFALAFEWKVNGNERAQAALSAWFEWHDRNIDPKTGFWDFERTGNVLRAMAGGMHQLGIYFLFGREVPYHERAVKATLGLQQKNGLFSPDTWGHHGLDMDAVFVIANLYNRYGGSASGVRSVLERAFEANLKCFHPEGGAVSRAGVDRESDAWSTWCRVAITGWSARILRISEYLGPWDFSHRHPFHSEDGGKALPDWLSDKWYDAADWPRPAASSRS
jgi:hypothetical protein